MIHTLCYLYQTVYLLLTLSYCSLKLLAVRPGGSTAFFCFFGTPWSVGLLELFGVVHCFIYENFKSNWIWVCI